MTRAGLPTTHTHTFTYSTHTYTHCTLGKKCQDLLINIKSICQKPHMASMWCCKSREGGKEGGRREGRKKGGKVGGREERRRMEGWKKGKRKN